MKHIAGWFRRNRTLMAQAKDLSRQLQEAWDKYDSLAEYIDGQQEDFNYIVDQLHRVARERDKWMGQVEYLEEQLDDERTRRADAECALLDNEEE